jgi:hypothetical protein
MPTAICDSGHLNDFRNTRGSRLTDQRCRTCGGTLHRATVRNGSYVRAESRYAGAKRAMVECVLCGKRRDENAKTVVRPTEPFVFVAHNMRLLVPHDAGVPICAHSWHVCLASSGIVAPQYQIVPGSSYAMQEPMAAVFACELGRHFTHDYEDGVIRPNNVFETAQVFLCWSRHGWYTFRGLHDDCRLEPISDTLRAMYDAFKVRRCLENAEEFVQ